MASVWSRFDKTSKDPSLETCALNGPQISGLQTSDPKTINAVINLNRIAPPPDQP
jgi:hypothetical protein